MPAAFIDRRVKGNRVRIPDDPVTVNREFPESRHWMKYSQYRRLDSSEKARESDDLQVRKPAEICSGNVSEEDRLAKRKDESVLFC